MVVSQACTYTSLASPELRAWSDRLRPIWDPDGTDPKPFVVHRKMWEWLFICHALHEHDMLRAGRRGLGFGVGREPLVALFAAGGCQVLATDLEPDRAQEAGWSDGGEQYSGGLTGLNDHHLCPDADFTRRVAFRYVDMNTLPRDLGEHDFTWSSCAFEHLGSIDAGLAFVVDQMRYVRPGGVAVHTTELNVSSDDDTVAAGGTVLFRRHDLEGLLVGLRDEGYVTQGDFALGDTPADRHVDVPPFSDTHLRTAVGAFVTTSAALVIEKPVDWSPRRRWMRRPRRSATVERAPAGSRRTVPGG